jgi:hypothetical protein
MLLTRDGLEILDWDHYAVLVLEDGEWNNMLTFRKVYTFHDQNGF